MARRSLLLSKQRGSRATPSKKRKADRELQQQYSSKRTKWSSLQYDEEEIGDFIVVDTGKLNEPEETQQSFTIQEDDDVITTFRTPNTLESSLEDMDVAAKARSQIPRIESDTEKQAKDALLVLDSASTETVEGKRSRPQSPEIYGNHIPSDSEDGDTNDGPALVSPLPVTNNKGPQSLAISPGPISDEAAASISRPLAPVAEPNEKSPQASEEIKTVSQPSYPSKSLASTVSPEPPLKTVVTQRSTDDPYIQSMTHQAEPALVQVADSEEAANNPLGVLVTKGDQCPSKFVVSGITATSEPIRTKIEPQGRDSVSWIETVTEARSHVPSEIPESRLALKSCDTQGLSISKVLQDAPQSPRQALTNIFPTMEQSITLLSCSDALEPPQQSSRNCESGLGGVRQDLTEVPKQSVPDQQCPLSRGIQENDRAIAGGTESKKLSLPIQYPKISSEATAFVGPNVLEATADKIVGAWWTSKVSCLDIPPPGNSKSTPKKVSSRLPKVSPGNSSPSLRFTFDNRAESTLTTVEVKRLVQMFVRDAVAIVPRQQSAQPKTYPAGVIMWQSLSKFYKWYAKEEKREIGESSEKSGMKFELLDVHWQPENVFLIPKKGNLDQFRALKQCVWDLFWVASNLNNSPATFRILVTRAPDMANEADFSRLTAGKIGTLNQFQSILLSPSSTQSASENPVSAESSQGPKLVSTQHYHRLPVVRPSPPTINSPLPVTLEVGATKTTQTEWGFPQSDRDHDANRPASVRHSSTRLESDGYSALRTDLLHPPLIIPESIIPATFQQQKLATPPSTSALNDDLGAQYQLSPPPHFGTHRNPSSSSQTHTFPLPNFHSNSAIQLPRPSPAIIDASNVETSHGSLTSSGSNYTANTARHLFAMPPQKDGNTFRPLLPSNQPNRVVNTARPVLDPQLAQIPPLLTTDKIKDMQMDIITPVLQASRTPGEKMRLRDNALQMISGRQDIELEEDETTGGRKRTYPEISGVIVDKKSAMGIVVITERGYTIQQVDTGQDVYVDQYTELILRDGQACVIHGSSTVLYYKPRILSGQSQLSPPPRKPLPSHPRQTDVPKIRRTSSSRALEMPLDPALNPVQFTTEIAIRLQIDAVGRFSAPYDLSVFRPGFRSLDFFKWFGLRTNHSSSDGPQILRFTLKDAMPVAKVCDVVRGDEEDYRRVREDILEQCEKAKMFMPRLREFGALIVDPTWKDANEK